MFRLLWAASVRTRYYLRRYMPTNVALDAIRTRRGLKWGVPAMLLAVPYLVAASVCTSLIADGSPGWLNLLVLLFTGTLSSSSSWGRSASCSWFAPVSASRRRSAAAAERVTTGRSSPHRQNERVSLDGMDAPSEGVVVERLRTEATNWINAVALQSGRIGRRFRNQYPEQAEVQALEVDLHFFLVAVVRLRRCIERTARRVLWTRRSAR